MRLIVDGKPIQFTEDDSVLSAMLRAGEHPTGGGCLCCAGDCPYCVATINGVSYVRTCQTKPLAGMVVETDHKDGAYPPLPKVERTGAEVHARNLHCDAVVIGQGESGRQAALELTASNKSVIVLDSKQGQDVLGVYDGPLVVARSPEGMLHIHAKSDVVVATGSAEIQPVAPGNLLKGIVTARAAESLHAAGIDLGHIVAIGTAPADLEVEQVFGRIVRFEGDDRISGVVVADVDDIETQYPCDTVSVGLGLQPRDALARQGHDIPQVRKVGDAAMESDIPPCPAKGIVCSCSNVSVEDLQYSWDSGFHELELVKRATLAGTGTCQGSVCIPHMRSFLADRGKILQKPFTARPLTKQATIEEVAAGAHFHAVARTALDGQHRELGAQMERSGSWWRPWNYGNFAEEYWAVREAVSIMDVSTLGKMRVTGPDALAFLERIYPTQVATIREGRSRYALMLNENGYIFDDGMIAKEGENAYYLTFTSGGSSHAEMWMRDWANNLKMDVRIMLLTQSYGAINVTGPLSNKLLELAGVTGLPKFLGHQQVEIAGVDCKVFRLSFTGEISYELHHSVADSVKLWTALLEVGKPLGIKPHGLEALTALRLEKGHIIVNQDTDLDSSPRRVHHEWMINDKKAEPFIGRIALNRINQYPLDKQLVGLEMTNIDPDQRPAEGSVIWVNDQYAGYVTSSTYSPILGKAVMLGWLDVIDGSLPDEVMIHQRAAQRVATPFYDKEGSRARA